MNNPLHLSVQGEYAVLCDPNPAGQLDLTLQQRLWTLAHVLNQQPDVRETVLGMNNILVIFREPCVDLVSLKTRLRTLWQDATPATGTGRVVAVPVRYGGAAGIDLPDVARATGLSIDRYVALHASATYTVYALGSQPGYAYLGGLPAALAVPRRPSPRPSVAAGTVMVGGEQAGIQSRTTPSGWHLLGMCEVQSFDPQAEPPAFFAPGDTVRFVIQSVSA